MKKLLSLVLVTVMVLSSVVTCFAVSADTLPSRTNPDREAFNSNPEDYVVDFWLSDATIADGETTASITANVANNFGIYAARFFVVYPGCLTISTATANYVRSDPYSPDTVIYTRDDIGINTNQTTANATIKMAASGRTFGGMTVEELIASGYKFSTVVLQCAQTFLTQDDYDNETNEQYFCNTKAVDGALYTLKFTYDETANTAKATELPIYMVSSAVDALFCYGDMGVGDGEFTPVDHDGVITVPEQAAEACNHATTHQEVVTEATCTEAGSANVVCDDCGEVIDTVVIDALGHTLETIPAVAATCTEEGATEGSKCSVCGEILVAPTTVPATGHTAGEAVTTPATCTEDGSVTTSCTVCNEVLTSEPIPATGHTAVQMMGKDRFYVVVAPTTTAEGTLAKKCKTCGQYFDETALPIVDEYVVTAEGKSVNVGETFTVGIYLDNPATGCISMIGSPFWSEELTLKEVAQGNIGFIDEDWSWVEADETLVADIIGRNTATDIEFDYAGLKTGMLFLASDDITTVNYNDGYVAYFTFTAPATPGEYRFGIVLNDEYGTVVPDTTALYAYEVNRIVEATISVACTHTATHEEVVKEATCTEAGSKNVVCDNCGVVVETLPIDMVAHTEEEIPAVEATCTSTGLTAGVMCSVCGEILVAQEEVPMAAHTEEEIPAVEATCTSTGLTAGVKCSVCGEILVAQEEVPMAAHTEETIPAVEATCTDTGLTAGVQCSVCGEILVAQEEVPAKGHSYGEWGTVKAPTQDEEGLAERYCTVCQAVDSKVLDKLPTKVLNLRPEYGYYANAAACSIDNNARVINIVTKKNAPMVDFRFLNSTYTFTFSTSDPAVRTRLINGKYLDESGVVDDTSYVRYFEVVPQNGLTQTFTLHVTYKDYACDYTVNVEFTYGPACTGIEPGYFAASAGFDADDANVINVVSKPGAKEVDFRLINMAKGSYATLDEGSNAYVKQWVKDLGAYDNVTLNGGETNTQWKYFYAEKVNGAEQSYGITVHLIDGTEVNYTVNVTFIDR